MPRFVALDSWRGIAAVAVALFHINADHGLPALGWHAQLGLAVDFFFVLSGFVIAGAFGARLASGYPLRAFLALRLGRIWPLHAVVLLVYAALECLYGALGWMHGGHAAFTGPRDPLALLWSALLVQAWVLPGQIVWVAPSWSVSIELLLYLGAALAWRIARGPGTALLVAAALGALAAGAFAPEWIGAQWWLQRGIAGFGLGAGVWWLWTRTRARPLPPRLATAGEALAVFAAALAVGAGAPLIVADPVFAALVWAFARDGGALSRVLARRGFVMLGAVSYAIYLTHGFVLSRALDLLALIEQATGARLTGTTAQGFAKLVAPAWLTDLIVLAMLGAAIAVARLAFAWIEAPARAWSRGEVQAWLAERA